MIATAATGEERDKDNLPGDTRGPLDRCIPDRNPPSHTHNSFAGAKSRSLYEINTLNRVFIYNTSIEKIVGAIR